MAAEARNLPPRAPSAGRAIAALNIFFSKNLRQGPSARNSSDLDWHRRCDALFSGNLAEGRPAAWRRPRSAARACNKEEVVMFTSWQSFPDAPAEMNRLRDEMG